MNFSKLFGGRRNAIFLFIDICYNFIVNHCNIRNLEGDANMDYLYDKELVSAILDDDVIIVMDTNVWLDLYTLAPSTIKLIIDSIEMNNGLFWMPNQVFVEFNRHVGKSRDIALNRYKDLKNSTCQILNNAINSINVEMNKLKNKGNTDAIPVYDGVISNLSNQIKDIVSQIYKIDSEYIKETECINKENDIISNLVNFLHEHSVTLGFNVTELIEIYEEGEKRYKYKVSPGYTDESKKEKSETEPQFLLRKYGDLILWKEVLRKVKNQQTSLIFVQNERKSDWWDKRESDNKNIPRVLKEEFGDAALEGTRFLMIDFEEFIYHYGNKFEMPDTSIQQITLKLKYQKALTDYLEANKNSLVEEHLLDNYQDCDYKNPLCYQLNDLSFFGGSVDSVDDFYIDNINIIKSEVIDDDNDYDLRSIESKAELECTAYITEYVNKYVYHNGRIKVKLAFDLIMDYFLNISSVDLECKDAIEINDTSIDNIEILSINSNEFDIDVCVDEDLFRDR